MLVDTLKGEPTAQTHIKNKSHIQLPNVRPARQQTAPTAYSIEALAPWSPGCLTRERK